MEGCGGGRLAEEGVAEEAGWQAGIWGAPGAVSHL